MFRLIPLVLLVATICLPATAWAAEAIALPTAGAYAGWDAATPGATPATRWDPVVQHPSDDLWWSFSGPAPTLTGSDPSSYPGINAAFVYTGSTGPVGFASGTDPTAPDDMQQGFGSGFTTSNDVSFEIWFRPSSLAGGNRLIWEEGGGNGSAMFLTNDELNFRVTSGGVVNLSTTLTDNSEFIQAVGTIDMNAAGNETVSFYVNGQLVGTDSSQDIGLWAGTNGGGIGNLGGSSAIGAGPDAVFGPFGNFLGDVAVFNIFDEVLTSDAVLARYLAATEIPLSPEPSSIALCAVALGAVCFNWWRKRRPA